MQLGTIDIAILLVGSFLGSFVTASTGVGGGSLLIAIMASVLPPVAIIPIHGMVQLGSNGTRFALTRAHADYIRVLPFWLGALLAFALGFWLLPSFEFELVPLIIAVFIIFISWVNIPKLDLLNSPKGMLFGGVLTSYISLFVGATGPLVAAWIGLPSKDKLAYTANFSACMSLQHLIKIVLFIVLGFQFVDWILLIIAMIATGYLGTKVGLRILKRIELTWFKRLFKWLLTLLSLKLMYSYFSG